jgi:SAM-dependent methyltransferase
MATERLDQARRSVERLGLLGAAKASLRYRLNAFLQGEDEPAQATGGQQQPSTPPATFRQVGEDLTRRRNESADLNLEWNRRRWDQEAGWQSHDAYGYEWGSKGVVHTASTVARFFDRHLRPFVGDRYDLDILEISPGAGRVTVELIRYAQSMTLVDLSETAINICRERLFYYPTPVDYFVNDGQSLACVSDRTFDLVASYDSMVHVHSELVRGYVTQSADLLRPGGLLWMDHSGKGANEKGRRSEVTDEMMARWGKEAGLELLEQTFRNDHDCISVFEKPASS